MEMLFTSVTKPQVLMTIDDIEALCANADCDYEYVAPSSDISSFTVSGVDVSITGTSLPTSDLTVEFGGATCSTVTSDGSSASCTLGHLPRGGDHLIELRDANGLVPISASAQTIVTTVTSVSPSTAVNQNGGDDITIVGTGFPNGADLVEVVFTDDTGCTIVSSTPTEIICNIDGFVKPVDTATAMQFEINYVAPIESRRRRMRRSLFSLFPPSNDFSFDIDPVNPLVLSVSPNSVNPVIKNDLTFTLQDYTDTMNVEDFSITLFSLELNTVRELSIMSVDDGAKTVTAYFSGAASGTYYFKVRGASGSI